MSELMIAMYHYVRTIEGSRYPNIKGLEYKLFREQLNFFRKNFHVVTMKQVINAFEYGEALPKNALLLTFDDGYIDHYVNVFPLLKSFEMQGSFFVPGKVFTEHKLLDVNKIHFILEHAPISELLGSVMEKIDRYYKMSGGGVFC